MTTKLVDAGFSNKNIVTGTSVYTYLIPIDGKYRFNIYVHGVQASGTYYGWIENQLGSGSNSSILAPKTQHDADTNKGYFGFASISLDLVLNDNINIMVDGLTGDTSVSGTVRIWRENYSTLVQSDILSDATPFAGANIDVKSSSRASSGSVAGIAATLGVAGAGLTALGDARLANLNATVSSRSTLTQAQILSDATPFPGADIDAKISTRSTLTVANILAGVFEGAYTIQDFFRLSAAVLFGKSIGGGTANPRFRDMADLKNRVDATTDVAGNRTNVNRDAT